MKKTSLQLITFFGILLLLASCQQKVIINRMVESKKDGLMLLGSQSLDQFQKDSFKNWYNEEHDAYPVSETAIKNLKKYNLSSFQIIVFLGTWCSDSHRELPRLIKILEATQYPMQRLSLIGVNRKKQSPSGDEGLYNIEKVPTIILKKYGKEVGRIVEQTQSGFLEKDLLKIIQKNKK